VDSLHRGVARRKLRQHASRSSIDTKMQFCGKEIE
jgi:hypothetical protein